MFPLDSQLFFAINHGLKSGVNDIWLGYATWLGNGWIAFPIAIIALFALDRSAFWRNFAALALAGIVGGVLLNVIKQAVHAPRPLTVFAADITSGKVYINVLFDKFYYNSFPSGHTQTAFTIATVLAWAGARALKINFWRGVGIFAVAAIVGVSRVYCGAHFPSDIVAGAALGSGTAIACCWMVGRWNAKAKYD